MQLSKRVFRDGPGQSAMTESILVGVLGFDTRALGHNRWNPSGRAIVGSESLVSQWELCVKSDLNKGEGTEGVCLVSLERTTKNGKALIGT